MLYFTGRGAGDCGLTTALLNVAADGLTVVALVTEHLFGITVDLLHQGWERGDIVRLPWGNHDADRQALGVGACVDLVEKPPRERPSALRSAPLFHRRRNDAHG